MIGPNNGAVINVLSYIPTQYWDGIRDGSNTTDLTSYIQAAIDSLIPLFIPAGTFLTDQISLYDNTAITGLGYDSVLKLIDSADNTMLTNNDTSTSISNVVLENFRLDGNLANQTQLFNRHGVGLRNTRNSIFRNLWISDVNGDGISITEDSSGGEPLNTIVENIITTGYLRNGIAVTSGTNIKIINPICYSSHASANPGDGIDIEINSPRQISGVNVINPTCYSNVGQGIAIRGTGADGTDVDKVRVLGGECYSNTGSGVLVADSYDSQVIGMNCYSNAVDGIRVIAIAVRTIIANNSCIGNTNRGIQEVTNADGTPDYTRFISNVCASNTSSDVINLLGTNSEKFMNNDGDTSVIDHPFQIGKSNDQIIHTDGYIQQAEISDPAAPSANRARLYAKDNGASKTQLVVRFPTGAVQVIATEP